MRRSTLVMMGWLALGCSESVESTDIRTTGIYPEITITADGSGSSEIEVALKVGGRNSNTYLQLRGDDELEVSAEGFSETFEGSGDIYKATLPLDDPNTQFVIAFQRGDQDDSAPASIVSLPAPFEMMLGAPAASRATDEVTVTWDPAGTGDLTWEYEGECVLSEDGNTPDDGETTFGLGEIRTFESDANESCTVDVLLARSRGGTIDPAFTDGGRIVARQVRSDSFLSVP
jgi:hypothetical protein